MRKTVGFKIRDMWYNLGEYFEPSDNAAIIPEFGLVYSVPASNARGITRQYFILSSFTVCCCFVYHIIRFILCLLGNEGAAYCLLKSYYDISV